MKLASSSEAGSRRGAMRRGFGVALLMFVWADAADADAPASQAAIETVAAQSTIAPSDDAPSADPGVPEAGDATAPAEPAPPPWGPIELLDDSVAPGQMRRLNLVVSSSLEGVDVDTPVFVHRGVGPGPTLCVTAGIHGDEVNGVEIVRRVVAQVRADEIQGTLISVPIVNVSAVRRGSRYLPDRRDLNRYFPGHPHGSAASRIANRFFENVIRHCEALVDIHTASLHRKNLHQLRADLRLPQVLSLARGLGSEIVVHNTGRRGTLRAAAVEAGIAAVTIEGGEPARLSIAEVERSVRSIERLLVHLGMSHQSPTHLSPLQEFYDRAPWIRAAEGGILVSQVQVGQRVVEGQELGTITDPLSSHQTRIVSPYRGRIIGVAFDQLVMPGFATFHIAVSEGPPTDTPGPGLDPDPDFETPMADIEPDERPE